MKKKIYISGRITGIEHEAAAIFAKAEKELRAKGFEPVNPTTLNHEHDKTWEAYMKVCIYALLVCDGIYMLENWGYSKGAKIEYDIAEAIGLEIINNS